MNETLKTLIGRRSVRKFRSEQIKEEELKQILEAGKFAPTGMGAQSPTMVVIQDRETLSTLSALNAAVMGSKGDPFYGAPTVILVLADPARSTYIEDGSLVMGNLMNAAFSLGVDSCWIHRAREVFASDAGKALLRKWGVKDTLVGIGHCALGYREGGLPDPKPRKEDYVFRV